MKVKIYNLNKLFELRRDNNFYDKVFYSGDTCIGLLLLGIIGSLMFLPAPIANCFTDASIKIKLLCFLIPIVPFIIIHLMLYFMSRNVFKDDMKYGVNILNKVYVNSYNENEVVLLYELIKHYGFSSFTVEDVDDYKIEINLNTKYLEFKEFDDFKHSRPEIKELLTEHIIPKKKLSESEALSFYNEYINPKIEGKKLSFDEKEQALKQLAKLNKVNL